MLWSLLARRMALRAIDSTTARLPIFPVGSRRALFATSPFNSSPTKVSESTGEEAIPIPKTPKEKASKGKRVVLNKRGRPSKSMATHQEEQPKQEKQRIRIPKHLQPPKRAPGPYLIFYAYFVKSQPKAATLEEFRALSKRASEIWRGYSMAEKQPFYDENETRKAQAKQEREEFFRQTSLSDLKQLNAIRKAQGKTKFRSTKKASLPLTPFILFSSEFRNSPDGQALIDKTSTEKKYTIRAVIAAADRWRTMSEEEKAPYFERFRKAKEELKAE